MKKQIFKLTSILLAMVMVFSMFSMIPISAEGSAAEKTAAVDALKTAWKSLRYMGEADSIWDVSFFYKEDGSYDAYREGVLDANYKTEELPDTVNAENTDIWKFPLINTSNGIVFSNTKAGEAQLAYDFDILEDIYFYYYAESDANFLMRPKINKTNTDVALTSGATSLSATDGSWVKFSLRDFFDGLQFNNWEYRFRNNTDDAMWRFYMYLQDTNETTEDFYISKLFMVADKNLIGSDGWSEDDWIVNAHNLDLSEYDSAYAGGANVNAFKTALDNTKGYYTDIRKAQIEDELRAAAGEMITSATYYDKPVKSATSTTEAAYITPVVSNNSKYGSHTATVDLPAQSAKNQITGSLWFNNTIGSDRGANYYGDYPKDTYFMVKVNSADAGAKLRFWFRPSGNNSLDAAFNYELPVVAGEEYKITLAELFESGVSSKNSEWNEPIKDWRNNCTSASTSSYKYSVNIFCMFAYQGAVNVTVGSMVSTTNYTIPENIAALTGEEFVAAMTEVSLDDKENTAPFVALLNEAAGYYPEVEKAYAVKSLKNSWNALTFAGTAGSKTGVSRLGNTWVTDKSNATYWVDDAPEGIGADDKSVKVGLTTSYLNVIYANEDGKLDTTILAAEPKWNELDDLYFYYKSSSTVKMIVYMTYTNKTDAASTVGESNSFSGYNALPASNGQWTKVSIPDFLNNANGQDNWNNRYKPANSSYEYISRIQLTCISESASAEAYFSNMFFEYDSNLYGSKDWNDEKWIRAAYDADLDEVKKDYTESADSTEWKTFKAAVNKVLELNPELVAQFKKSDKVGALRKAWKAMVEATPIATTSSNLRFFGADSKEVVTNEAATDVYGEEIKFNVGSTGFGAHCDATANNFMLYDGSDIVINTITDYGFWYKVEDSINARISIMQGSTDRTYEYIGSPVAYHDIVLEGGNNWKFISIRKLFGETAWSGLNSVYGGNNGTIQRIYVDLGSIVDTDVATTNITFGGMASCKADTTIAGKTEDEVISGAYAVDFDAIPDSAEKTAFTAELKNCLEYLPDSSVLAVLKNIWMDFDHIPYDEDVNVNMGRYVQRGSNGTEIFTLNNTAVRDTYKGTDAEVGEYYHFPVWRDAAPEDWDVAANGEYVTNHVEVMEYRQSDSRGVAFDNTCIEDLKFWYKADTAISNVRFVFYYGADASTESPYMNNRTLPATNGWELVSVKNIIGGDYWSTYASYDKFRALMMVFCDASGRPCEVSFGEMVAVRGDIQTVGIDTWSEGQLVYNAKNIDFSKYDAPDTSLFDALLAKAETLYANELNSYEAALIAQDVIDASKKLDKLALKPNVYALSDNATQYTTVYDTSNNGDYYATFKGSDGNNKCAWSSGYVEYNTNAPITLADINDLYFSYRVDGFDGDNISARFYIYNEDFGFDTVYDEETGEVVKAGVSDWDCRFHSINGGESVLKATADTNGWVTTSIGAIFGSNWKNSLVFVLNEADNVNGNPNWKDKTAEEIKISAIRLGFNNMATCDISLGSMYVDYVDDSETAITESASNPAAVLEAAREINLSNVNPAQANEFKKLVKALETKIKASVKTGYIAGNWYADGLTLKDLSVLSRYNNTLNDWDNKLGDTFFDKVAAGSLTEESIRKQLLGIPS